MSSSRQLAAIMFTDIVGYTALMGNDEQKAFAIEIYAIRSGNEVVVTALPNLFNK